MHTDGVTLQVTGTMRSLTGSRCMRKLVRRVELAHTDRRKFKARVSGLTIYVWCHAKPERKENEKKKKSQRRTDDELPTPETTSRHTLPWRIGRPPDRGEIKQGGAGFKSMCTIGMYTSRCMRPQHESELQ